MRTTILTICLLGFVACVLAQGTVVFNNRVVGAVVAPIYGPNPANIYAYQSGNGSGGTPAGTMDWTAYPLLSGPEYTAELWAAPGLNQPESSLVPATPRATFRTGVAAGFISGVEATMPNVSPLSTGGATLAIRVWDNQGGTITSWAMAQAGTGAWGESVLFNITAPIGAPLITDPTLVGLRSFNIHYAVPEPSALALAALGSAVFLISRCRKESYR